MSRNWFLITVGLNMVRVFSLMYIFHEFVFNSFSLSISVRNNEIETTKYCINKLIIDKS